MYLNIEKNAIYPWKSKEIVQLCQHWTTGLKQSWIKARNVLKASLYEIYFKGKSECDITRKTNRRRRSAPEMLGVIQPCFNGNEQAAIKEMKVTSFVLFLRTWRLWWCAEEPIDIYIVVADHSTSKAKCPFCIVVVQGSILTINVIGSIDGDEILLWF